MATGDAAHARHGGHGRGDGTRGQVDDPLAIGPWTSDALRGALADKQTVAWAANVLLARRSISNGLWISKGRVNIGIYLGI